MQFVRVTSEPTELVANTIYLIQDGASDLAITVVGTTAASVRRTVARSAISTMISNAIAGLDNLSEALVVANITARDALTPAHNVFCLVKDATGDVTVAAGAALYFYEFATETWIKLSEYESMDVVIPNQEILEDLSDDNGSLAYGGQVVTPNRAILAALSDSSGELQYNGQPIGGVTSGTNQW